MPGLYEQPSQPEIGCTSFEPYEAGPGQCSYFGVTGPQTHRQEHANRHNEQGRARQGFQRPAERIEPRRNTASRQAPLPHFSLQDSARDL